MIALDCIKSHIYNLMPKEIIEKTMQEIASKTLHESRWNPKACSHNAQQIKEREAEIRMRT